MPGFITGAVSWLKLACTACVPDISSPVGMSRPAGRKRGLIMSPLVSGGVAAASDFDLFGNWLRLTGYRNGQRAATHGTLDDFSR